MNLAAALCRQFEGYASTVYLCPAGVPTVGFGSTFYADGRRVTMQDPPMGRGEAEELLQHELRTKYGPAVLRHCPTLINDERRCAAIVDFCYNLGVGRLQTSTLKRKVNDHDWKGAQEQLRLWVRGGGRVLPGLVKRREAEAQLLG